MTTFLVLWKNCTLVHKENSICYMKFFLSNYNATFKLQCYFQTTIPGTRYLYYISLRFKTLNNCFMGNDLILFCFIFYFFSNLTDHGSLSNRKLYNTDHSSPPVNNGSQRFTQWMTSQNWWSSRWKSDELTASRNRPNVF